MVTRVPLRAVIFDWDGTLLDSYSADTNAYLQMFRAMGIPWGIADLERHYSPDWYNVYRAADLPIDRWREADRLWRHFYRSERPRLRPGARQVIEHLRSRYRLALVTSGAVRVYAASSAPLDCWDSLRRVCMRKKFRDASRTPRPCSSRCADWAASPLPASTSATHPRTFAWLAPPAFLPSVC